MINLYKEAAYLDGETRGEEEMVFNELVSYMSVEVAEWVEENAALFPDLQGETKHTQCEEVCDGDK